MDQRTILFVVLAAAAVAVVALFYLKQQRSKHLRSRFGEEYQRTVVEKGSTRLAEAELARRENRVVKFRLRSLTSDEAQRYATAWKGIQARFVDDPAAAATDAERLLQEVMHVRGYPAGDFEELAADVSVDHPRFVEEYRKAHRIAVQHERGDASTEELRQAITSYRALFEDLLESRRAA